MFCTACELKTHFLVRTCVDRLAGDGHHTITTEMEEVRVKGLHHVEVVDSMGKPAWATLELRYRRVHVLPPIGKQKDYPALTLTVICARERDTPQGRKPIDWKLITDLPVSSRSEAIEKLHWYAQRWKIETFHKILKSGCKAEDAKLRTADRLANLVSIFCIVGWRIFWMTMMNRALPDVPATPALTQTEADLLDRLVVDKRDTVGPRDLSHYLNKIARLGGYLDRAHDAPPGNTVMWRGLTRLIYIELGFNIGTELMGN